MPVEAENDSDESDRAGFKEKGAEHEQHRSNEWNCRSHLQIPVPVEGGSSDGGRSEGCPQIGLEASVPTRRYVAEVVDGDVGDGGDAQTGSADGGPTPRRVLGSAHL